MGYSNSCDDNDSLIYYFSTNNVNDIVANFNIIDDVNFKVLLTAFLTVTAILSLVGNLCTCLVIVRNRSMRTPTNCYLFNLAIADLLTTLCVPIEIYIIWMPDYFPIGEIGCRIHFIIWDCLSNGSVLTIFAFTVERYIVITKPFLRRSLAFSSRVIKIIAFNWMLSCLFCLMQVFNVIVFEHNKGIYCLFKISRKMQIIMAFDLFVFFVLPMTVIFVIYVLIAVKLKYTNEKLKNSPANGKRNRDKAVTMLAAVAVSFFFCWFPYSVLRVMMIIPGLRKDDYFKIWQVFVYVSLINSYLSTAVNPILYSLMSRKFRQAFKIWQVFVYVSLINSYLSTAVNPILYSLMSRKFRQAFKNLLSGRRSLPLKRVSEISMLNSASNIRLKNLRQQHSF